MKELVEKLLNCMQHSRKMQKLRLKMVTKLPVLVHVRLL